MTRASRSLGSWILVLHCTGVCCNDCKFVVRDVSADVLRQEARLTGQVCTTARYSGNTLVWHMSGMRFRVSSDRHLVVFFSQLGGSCVPRCC
jgi:hypothetical protein